MTYFLRKQKFDDKAGTSDARMPLPEPTDLDKAGHLKFEELEASLKQLNREIQGIVIILKQSFCIFAESCRIQLFR